MKWENRELGRLPIKSWCQQVDGKALTQAVNLANHPVVVGHVALMPDCHVGFGMPIGGVVGCDNAIIPNAVGVDIGCGMGAVQTDIPVSELSRRLIKEILHDVKRSVPVGEGRAHRDRQAWSRLDERDGDWPGGVDARGWDLAYRNLGTLGGGNHFIELQAGADGFVWLMIHSGSRNLGYRIAEHFHKRALALNESWNVKIPDRELAYLPMDSAEGQSYLRDMNFALDYARENRRRILDAFETAVANHAPGVRFRQETNIHHNYAALERHFGRDVWIHRKGATSACEGEVGIVPGSMGTPSYIVKGLGNADSFHSCSHGAGRVMGRMDACRTLTREACDKAMEGVVFDGWRQASGVGRNAKLRGLMDFEEAPPAYKDIEQVIESELDLVEPVVKLRPLGVVKG